MRSSDHDGPLDNVARVAICRPRTNCHLRVQNKDYIFQSRARQALKALAAVACPRNFGTDYPLRGWFSGRSHSIETWQGSATTPALREASSVGLCPQLNEDGSMMDIKEAEASQSA